MDKQTIVLVLIAVCLILPPSLADSKCPANSLQYCPCPDGGREYYNLGELKELKKDPNSCCYEKKGDKLTNLLNSFFPMRPSTLPTTNRGIDGSTSPIVLDFASDTPKISAIFASFQSHQFTPRISNLNRLSLTL